jgi:hypothetical protein
MYTSIFLEQKFCIMEFCKLIAILVFASVLKIGCGRNGFHYGEEGRSL